MMKKWPFVDDPGTPAVTTHHITDGVLPILFALRDVDSDGEITWQFHCVTIAFSMNAAQIVRLDTILKIDPSIYELSDLAIGYVARRSAPNTSWKIERLCKDNIE